jgi:hypothetical protein
MTDMQTVVSDNTTHGSAITEVPQDDSRSDQSNDRVINPQDHDRAVQDMLKYKGKLKEASDAIQDLKTQIHELKSQGLKEKEDYKSLYEQECQNHAETKRRAQRLEGSFYTTQKHSAVYPALKRAGLRDDAERILEMVDFDALEVETTSEGRVIINGIETFVEKFKADFPFAFEQRRPPKINSAGGTTEFQTPQKITAEMIVEIERKHGTKSDKYKNAIAEYVKQRNAN